MLLLIFIIKRKLQHTINTSQSVVEQPRPSWQCEYMPVWNKSDSLVWKDIYHMQLGRGLWNLFSYNGSDKNRVFFGGAFWSIWVPPPPGKWNTAFKLNNTTKFPLKPQNEIAIWCHLLFERQVIDRTNGSMNFLIFTRAYHGRQDKHHNDLAHELDI